ncbi:MAG: ATP-binding protein [Paludibacteraceae bacterium]|nr:ATP-binding protein [Paludibacteraceae bacterium]
MKTKAELRAELRSKMIVTNVEIFEAGLDDEFTPPIENCQFCGKTLVVPGFWTQMIVPRGEEPSSGILWRGEYKGYKQPIRYEGYPCACNDAKAFQKILDQQSYAEKIKMEESLKKEKEKQWKERLFERSEIRANFPNHMTFDEFKVEEFSPDNSRWTQTQIAYRLSKAYVESYEEKVKSKDGSSYGKGLFYSGSTGSGKTHLAIATLRALTEKNVSTLAVRTADLFNRLRESYNDPSGVKHRELMTLYTQVEVLMIDDLGKTKPTEWTQEKLFQILDIRANRYLPVFITCNYTDDELMERLIPQQTGDRKTAEAIISRLRGNTRPAVMNTSDYRLTRQ